MSDVTLHWWECGFPPYMRFDSSSLRLAAAVRAVHCEAGGAWVDMLSSASLALARAARALPSLRKPSTACARACAWHGVSNTHCGTVTNPVTV